MNDSPSYFVAPPDVANHTLPSSSSTMPLTAIPPNPSIYSAERFADTTWVAVDPTALSGVATVGGTAHLYIGQ